MGRGKTYYFVRQSRPNVCSRFLLVASMLALAADAMLSASSPPFSVATNENRTLSLSPLATPQRGSSPQQTWKLFVDDSSAGKRQRVHGFGAAWTDAAVVCLDALTPRLQDKAMAALFGHGASSIRLFLMRHTIGQSDLTPGNIGQWSYDENGGAPDPQLANFSLGPQGARMTSWLKKMQNLDATVTLFGSPWSPPGWMKSADSNKIQAQYADAWVQYMMDYLTAFAARGVRVAAITPQNEPLHSSDSAWTTLMEAQQQVELVNMLGTALQQSKPALGVQVWAYDHNTDRPDYPALVLEQAGAFVDTVAWHCYSADTTGWAALTEFHQQHPSVTQIMTECWTHLKDENFFDLSDFVIGPMQNWAAGALAWTLFGSSTYDVSYPGGCDQCSGLVQVDRERGLFELTQDYYSMGQFSAFVRGASEGDDSAAVYLNSTGSYTYPDGTGVQAAAFRNADGTRVLVVQNKIRNDLVLQVSFASGDAWHGTVPARSVTTWVLPEPSQAGGDERDCGKT